MMMMILHPGTSQPTSPNEGGRKSKAYDDDDDEDGRVHGLPKSFPTNPKLSSLQLLGSFIEKNVNYDDNNTVDYNDDVLLTIHAKQTSTGSSEPNPFQTSNHHHSSSFPKKLFLLLDL